MSAFMPDQPAERQPSTPPKGPEEYLAPEERKFLQRYLSFPEEIPPKFKSWLIDFIAVNIPQIPISQIVGFTQFKAIPATTIVTEQSTSSASYANLTTDGPSLDGIADGQYLILFGMQIHTLTTTVTVGVSSVSINGSVPTEDESVVVGPGTTLNISTSRAVIKTLANGGNNSVKVQYRIANGGSGTFGKRWLIVLRTGN